MSNTFILTVFDLPDHVPNMKNTIMHIDVRYTSLTMRQNFLTDVLNNNVAGFQ